MTAPKVQRKRADAYQQSIDEVLAALDTDARRALSEAEARERFERYGKNELTAEKPAPAWKKFLAQFQDVLVILLLIATAISAGLWLFERDRIGYQPARGPDRRLGHYALRADDGFYYSGVFLALHRLQCSFGRAKRPPRTLHKRLPVGRGPGVALVAGRGDLRTGLAAGVLDCELELQ